MAEITKPTDLSQVWCSAGDLIKPSTTKISTGWEIEVPPRQWFNWLDNRQDQALAHINQHGIPVWDSATEYQANKSFTMGSDGKIYRCVATNTNTNPVTDTTNSYWTVTIGSSADYAPTSDGFVELVGGITLQWGTKSAFSGTSSVVFTRPFKMACFIVNTTVLNTSATENADSGYQVTAKGLSDFTAFRQDYNNTNIGSDSGFDWIAIGV